MALYGIPESPLQWFKTLRDFIISMGFTQCKNDVCVFTRKNSDGTVDIIIIHVDDNIIITNSKESRDAIKTKFREKFQITESDTAEHILGLQTYKLNGGTYIGMPVYIKKMLEEANLWDEPGEESPMSTTWKRDENAQPLNDDEKSFYISHVMKMVWISTNIRPDISFTANYLAQNMQNPNQQDMKALTRALKYLRSTYDVGLFYKRDKMDKVVLDTNAPIQENFENTEGEETIEELLNVKKTKLIGFSDASFAEEVGYKSRSAYVFLIGGCAVSWFSKKQTMVATSSTEAETYALSEACKELIWM